MLRIICRSVGVIAIGAAFLLATGSVAEAGDCRERDNGCQAVVNAEVYTDSPTIPCVQGDYVVRIEATFNCLASQGGGGSGGSTVAYRCSSDDTPIVFNDGTKTHTLSVHTNWGHVEQGRCATLSYTAQ